MVINAPNESRIRGKVIKIANEPESGAKVLQVKIEESFDVGEMPNFTKPRVGNLIKVYVPIDDERNLKENEDVNLSVSYQGDEGGGIFFITGDDSNT